MSYEANGHYVCKNAFVCAANNESNFAEIKSALWRNSALLEPCAVQYVIRNNLQSLKYFRAKIFRH